MAELRVEGYGTFEVPEDKRLLKAIEDSGVDILHRCGGNARCTTCRVKFYEGEPQRMTTAEFMRLDQEGLLGEARLSCQCEVEGDMHLKPLKTVSNSEHSDPGGKPADKITPEPEWVPLDEIPM